MVMPCLVESKGNKLISAFKGVYINKSSENVNCVLENIGSKVSPWTQSISILYL